MEKTGSKFEVGSTVGCGVIFSSKEVFFLVDGSFDKVICKDVDTKELYPTISMGSPNEEVKVNFGQQPFKFDVESMIIVSPFPFKY